MSEASHGQSTDASWLLSGLVQRVPYTRSALLLSTDGLVKAAHGLDTDTADHLAALSSGLYSLARSAGAGLYSAVADTTVELEAQDAAQAQPGRVMARDHGYCPHVVVQREARGCPRLPPFRRNPVADEIGIHSYLGAPLIDHTGMALGTICVIDQDPRPWGRQGLEIIYTRPLSWWKGSTGGSSAVNVAP